MPDTPDPGSARWTAIRLGLSLLIGFAWAWAAWPLFRWTYVGGHWPKGADPRWPLLALHLGATAAAPPTFAVGLLALGRGRASRRSRLRSPGVVACVAAALVLAIQVGHYPITRHVTMYGDLTRMQGDALNSITQYPKHADGLSWRTLVGAVAHDLGPGVGLVVLGVLIARRVARLPPTRGGPLDRPARALAAAWVALEVGFLMTRGT